MPKHKQKGPLSLQGVVVPKKSLRCDVSLPLRVTHRDSAAAGRGLPAYVHPSTVEELCHDEGQLQASSSLFLQLASGSDCVLYTRLSEDVLPGCIQVDEVQQANLRLCVGEVYRFSVFEPTEQHAGAAASAGWQQAAAAAVGDTCSDHDMQNFEPTAGPAAQEAEEAAAALPFELVDVDVEVRLLYSSATTRRSSSTTSSCSSDDDGASSASPAADDHVPVNAAELTQAFCNQTFGRVIAVNEYVVVEPPSKPPLLLRVTATNTLTAEEQQEAIGYHCFRGIMVPDTKVYFSTSTHSSIAEQQPPAELQVQQQLSHMSMEDPTARLSNGKSHQGICHQQAEQQDTSRPVQSRVNEAEGRLRLVGAISRAAAPPATNLAHIITSDGEWFPVKKKLLRPCIALTKAVRDSGDSAPEVTVDIDTLTFDRVLIFLEAQALGHKPPAFAIHLLDDLQQAAEHLCLRSLQEYCSHLKGSRQAALGVYTFADVQSANASGKVWLLLDGMVLDVGRWLPEHPGGATIIPAQSLNCDCSRFFEMYHASRESFLYLQEFYIGELVPADKQHVPLGGRQPASEDFMVQLREYTGFRQPLLQQLAHSTPATHLGARRV